MATTASWYGKAFDGMFGATAARKIDWVGDTIKVALMVSGYTPAKDTDTFWSDVSANEITGTGYTAGGVALTGKSISYNATAHEERLLAAVSTWTPSTITAYRAVVYKDTGTAGTSPLLGYVDFGGAFQDTAGIFSINWDQTLGIFRVAI